MLMRGYVDRGYMLIGCVGRGGGIASRGGSFTLQRAHLGIYVDRGGGCIDIRGRGIIHLAGRVLPPRP